MKDENGDSRDGIRQSSIVDRQSIPPSSFILPPSVPPPWHLEGAAVVFLEDWRSARMLVRYDRSPVGPYEEFALAHITQHGPTAVKMVVNSAASLAGGRRGWGFPKTLGTLKWEQQGRRIVFRAGTRAYRVRVSGLALPLRLSAWCWQWLDGRRVRVPVEVSGWVRPGWLGRRVALVIDPLKLDVLRPELLEE